ncbi:serine/threonine-protein kinase [Sphaerisporangium aureirubrum]|uniref:non-specific serine/threonine protein kinase n=1 Tax=Sphaerisporangium aureirubrum TaxID=1544736 RepID=A0ABW1NWB6_9ACTN
MPESSQVTERVVARRYRLLERIGRGGMGTVWRARDEVLGRDVAVKEILAPPELTGPEREIFTLRTFREARAAGRVSHAGVATVYDVFEENGHPWIVMQLVPSETLGAVVRDHGPLPPQKAAQLGLQVLAALRAAHAAGVLHRDVKPDNVLLTREGGRAVLTDFGIATLEDDSPVTRTGMLIGTPAFIAPERAAGGQASRASDLWSLGITLYVAVEGRSPFQRGNPLATLGAVMHDPPEPMRLAGPLGPLLDGLLRKDPAERMNAADAEVYLRMVADGLAPGPTAPATPVPAQRGGPHPLPVTGAMAPAPPRAAEPIAAEPFEGPRTGPFAVRTAVPAPPEGDGNATRPAPVPRGGSTGRGMALTGLGALVLSVGLVAGGAAWVIARMDGQQTAPSVSPTVRVTVSVTPSSAPSGEPVTRGDRPTYSQAPPPGPSSTPDRPDDRPSDQDKDKNQGENKDKDKKKDEGDKPDTPSEPPEPKESDGAGNEIPPGQEGSQGGPGPEGKEGGKDKKGKKDGPGSDTPLVSFDARHEASAVLIP